jgi:predicted dehydrogenase
MGRGGHARHRGAARATPAGAGLGGAGLGGAAAVRPLGIGLIGTGFMGKAHALAYRNARAVLGGVPQVALALLCDTPADRAVAMADQFGFERATDDWQVLVRDPAVDVVCITAPNRLHRDMALAALAAGKHVHCEKPLALTLADAEAMAAAAESAARRDGVRTAVGYNYVQNPAFRHACRLVEDGAIGRLVHFRGFVDEDYAACPGPGARRRRRRVSARLAISAAISSASPGASPGRSRA